MSNALGFVPKFICTVILLMTTSAGWADSRPISDFYGEFVGRVIANERDSDVDRDLNVSIRPAKDKAHFRIKWMTVIHKPNGKVKRKVYDIKFSTTNRPNIYASAMKRNVFGGSVPLDPLKGDPFVWARIGADTLTVHALLITDDGHYEMQTYDRTLNSKGLLLEYTRKTRGEQVKRITAQLVRITD